MALWNESLAGVSAKLPTYGGSFPAGQLQDNLDTAGGLVLSRVGTVGDVPAVLVTLASRVVEFGAAALVEQASRPEEQGSGSRGTMLWAQFEDLLERLVAGVEAAGGEPNIETRPAFAFAPPLGLDYRAF